MSVSGPGQAGCCAENAERPIGVNYPTFEVKQWPHRPGRRSPCSVTFADVDGVAHKLLLPRPDPPTWQYLLLQQNDEMSKEHTTFTGEDKAIGDHIEVAPGISNDVARPKPTEFSDTQLKSNLDQLPLLKAIAIFKKTTLICLIAGFTAATDGRSISDNRLSACLFAEGPSVRLSIPAVR